MSGAAASELPGQPPQLQQQPGSPGAKSGLGPVSCRKDVGNNAYINIYI
jgi:hypothetical protein